ncbi:MAG: hypothetical protein WBC36_17120, partial [Desulfobacterales bacterium]
FSTDCAPSLITAYREAVSLTKTSSRGQYLSPHMTLAEADYRYSLTEKWGIAAFAGIAGLYGDDTVDGDDRLFPAGGAGIFYQLNDEKMVVRADFAIGKDGNRGFYLKFGQPF